MSRPPTADTAASTSASGRPGSETSAADQPAALIARPVASIPAGSREEMYTRAPSSASAAAQARPSPLLAAVTSARLPSSPRSTGQFSPRRPGGGYPVVLTYHSATYWNRSDGSM